MATSRIQARVYLLFITQGLFELQQRAPQLVGCGLKSKDISARGLELKVVGLTSCPREAGSKHSRSKNFTCLYGLWSSTVDHLRCPCGRGVESIDGFCCFLRPTKGSSKV